MIEMCIADYADYKMKGGEVNEQEQTENGENLSWMDSI